MEIELNFQNWNRIEIEMLDQEIELKLKRKWSVNENDSIVVCIIEHYQCDGDYRTIILL